MKMITTIKGGQQPLRMLEVTGDLVEVDDFIKERRSVPRGF
jgi:hypothetical protein